MRYMTLVWLATAICWFACGCGLIEMKRSEGSGYGTEYYDPETDEIYLEREADLKQDAMGELDMEPGAQNGNNRFALEERIRLKKMELRIRSARERDQYWRHKPLMRDDRERIEFLSLPTVEGRDRWLEARSLSATNIVHPPSIQRVVEENDLVLGMTQHAVKDSWGEPEKVEVAGNPVFGNERWTYAEFTMSSEGYRAENRIIYFESGRVVGWERY